MFSSACRRSGFATVAGWTDPVALDWGRRVAAAGATVSGRTLAAVSRFTQAAKAAGYWSKINRLNLFCGNSLTAALVPVKAGSGSATDAATAFVAGDYSEATGITGDGSTKSLNTGLIATSLTANSTHLAVYNRSATTTGANVAIGAQDGSGGIDLYAPFTDGLFYSDEYDVSAGRVSAAAGGTPYGFGVGSRTAAGAHAIYRNGGSLASNATSGSALPAQAITVFAANSSGTPSSLSAHTFAAYSIGSGLSAGDVAAYYAHMQAFQQALGRSV